MEDLLSNQEKVVAEQLSNLKYLEEDFRRAPLPKTLISQIPRILKFINQLKISSGVDSNTLIEECQLLNLKQYLPEISTSIANCKLSDN